jgi:malate dehydrogenase (oxaloacetate-decarboxylating)(NADP+)
MNSWTIVWAVQSVFPNCCIHFGDWKGTDAVRYLKKYKDKVLCYNDDIQGTASVALAGLTTALQINQAPITTQRILFLGAGSAATGIANLIVSAMQVKGLSEKEARSRIALFDTHGLVVAERAGLAAHKVPFAQNLPASQPFNPRDLASEQPQIVAAIEAFKPTVLIGVSTRGGLFSREVVEAMSRLNDRPIIFPLSNPTSKTECLAEQAYTWSKGKALYAAGVQFPDVTVGGTKFHPGQANNFYIYPAIGLATYVAKPTRLTDECFIVAAQATADQVDAESRAKGRLFPRQTNILETEVTTATRVADFMFDKGLAQVERPADVRSWIERQLYVPSYRALR